MATRSGPGRGLRGFRLSDVPEDLRLRALDKLLKTDGSADGMLLASESFTDRVALGIAATRPSDRVYWVSKTAWDRAVKPRRRAKERAA